MIDSRFYQLVDHLWRGGKYGYFWTPNDGTGAKYTFWLTVTGDIEVPKLFEDKDAYFAVNPSIIRRSEHERARIEDVRAVNGFFVEFDCSTPEAKEAAAKKIHKWKIPASCVIDSGGGYHVYVFLRSTFAIGSQAERQRAADLQWAFVQYVGGEKGVSDLVRVLRIPGTYNRKPKYLPDSPLVTIVEWQPQRQYELADLEPLLQPFIDKRDKAKAHTPHTPSGAVGLSDSELLDVLFKSKNGALYERLYHGDLTDADSDHSVADQMLCNGLAWLTGRDIARMDSLFRQSGLYRDKWADRAEYRERTLNNAADSAQTVYTPLTVDPDAVKAAQAAVGMNGTGPHVNGSQPSGGGPQAQQTSGGTYKAPQNPTTADFVRSLRSLNFHFRLNDLDDRIEVNGQPIDKTMRAEIRSKMFDLGYRRYLDDVQNEYLAEAGRNRYHPIKDYLRQLQWNGDDHIRLLARYFEDAHSPIVYASGQTERVFYVWLKRWLVGAVAKVFENKTINAQNAVLVLEGGQNLGKSTFVRWLCSGMPQYFIEKSIEPDNKEDERRLANKWIWEVGELGATTRKADRELLKSFLTRGECSFRKPYAEDEIQKPALASFVGTVNNEGGFLQDSTGTRRFMTVGLLSMDHRYVEDVDIDQLWAQAYRMYQNGESWRLLPEEAQKCDELNGDYKVEDTYEGWVKRYFEIDATRAAAKTPGWFTTTQEIVSELKNQGVTDSTSSITTRLAATMKELGLEKDRFPKNSGARGYWGIKIRP